MVTLGGKKAQGFSWENYLTLVAPTPVSAQTSGQDSRDKPLYCFSGAPFSQRVCGPRCREGIVEKGRPGLGQGRACKSQAWKQPQKKTQELTCQHPLTPRTGVPNQASTQPKSQLQPVESDILNSVSLTNGIFYSSKITGQCHIQKNGENEKDKPIIGEDMIQLEFLYILLEVILVQLLQKIAKHYLLNMNIYLT